MALTYEKEQRLTRASFSQLFDAHQALWLAASTAAYTYMRARFPQNVPIRPDDVAKVLKPTIEVSVELRNKLAASKGLTQKYWVDYFVDFIIDRTWDQMP